MKTLQDATVRIYELKGEALAMQCLMNAMIRSLDPMQREHLKREFAAETEAARVVLLNSDRAGESVMAGFERFLQQMSARPDLRL